MKNLKNTKQAAIGSLTSDGANRLTMWAANVYNVALRRTGKFNTDCSSCFVLTTPDSDAWYSHATTPTASAAGYHSTYW